MGELRRRTLKLLALVVLVACPLACDSGTKKNKKPTGTPTDPVEVCERLADVCRYKSSQLGVCVQADSDATKLTCAPQH